MIGTMRTEQVVIEKDGGSVRVALVVQKLQRIKAIGTGETGPRHSGGEKRY